MGVPRLESKWCNSLRSSKCPFATDPCGDGCSFLHIDQYLAMDAAERRKFNMPSIMERHARLLRRSYTLDLSLRAALYSNVYQQVCAGLNELGWYRHNVNDCSPPHVADIISMVVQTLHYDLPGTAAIMLDTLLLIERVVEGVSSAWRNNFAGITVAGIEQFAKAHEITHRHSRRVKGEQAKELRRLHDTAEQQSIQSNRALAKELLRLQAAVEAAAQQEAATESSTVRSRGSSETPLSSDDGDSADADFGERSTDASEMYLACC
eukprot:Rhum_TRINITY_DN14648_c9_g1::Rhum_TRINITY_DN14648_c9_g1_i1::g.107599::m.107599